MNDQNKDIQSKDGTQETKAGVPAAAPSFTWKRLLSKKWVFPAVYMAAAAIILTIMWVYQDSAKNSAVEDTSLNKSVTDSVNKPEDQAALPVTANTETLQWPVKDVKELQTTVPFYDEKASNEAKTAAVIQYGETYTPHTGIDFARQDNKEFDVLAAAGGKVTAVQTNVLAGKLVEITHNSGLVTVYQSLSDIKVTTGTEVKQGDVIAKAGRNELEKDEAVHLHFEVRKGADGPAVNPQQYLPDAEKQQ